MSRTRRFLRGVGVGYVSQALLAVVGLVVTRFLLHRLGQHDYGLWLVATQLLAYLALVDFGVVALLPREVAYATGRVEATAGGQPLPEIVGHTMRIVFWQMPMVALIALMFWIFLPADWEQVRWPLGIVMIAFVATFPLRVPPAALSGLQDLAFMSTLQTLALLMGTATTVTLVSQRWGLTALAIGWVVSQVILGVGGLARLRRRFPHAIPDRLPRAAWDEVKGRLGRGSWVSLSQVSVVLLNASDTVVIGRLLGAAAVVPYACTGKLLSFLANQPQLMMQTAQPGLAELRATGARPRVHLAATALTQAVLIASGAIACGVIAVNHGFVHLWLGEEQWGGFKLTTLVIAEMLGAHWNLTACVAIFAFGYERRLAVVGFVDGVLFVALATLLIPKVGVLGAPVARILSLGLVSLPLNLSALGREAGVGVPRLLVDLGPWAWRFVLAFALSAAIARFWAPVSFVSIGAAGTLAVGMYGLLMIGLLTHDPLARYLDPALAQRIRRLPRFLVGSGGK